MGSTPMPATPPPGGGSPTRSWFGRAWVGFRGLPVWGQVVVWALLWPVLAALHLLSATRPAAGRVAGAVVMLLLVAPVWALALTSLGAEGEPEPPESEAQPDSDPVPEPEAPPEADLAAEPDPDPEPDRGGSAPDVVTPSVPGRLEIHYLDVGQGDATLLLHDEVTVLIDTGRWQSSELVPLLRTRGVRTLDLVVITHPHADHLGQFDQVMDAFPVDEVWWSGSVTTSQTFERAVSALERSAAAYEEPRAGDRTGIGPLSLEVVNPPVGVELSDLHDAGLGLRVTFGEVRLLFTGDSEAATERRMAEASPERIDADILQLGHHGSITSTTPAFLAAVDPAVAIYSAGVDNAYGHPAAEVIDRIRAADIDLYGTDEHGTVVVTTDGTSWSIGTESSGVPRATPSSGSPSPPGSSPPTSTKPAPWPACPGDRVDLGTAGSDERRRIHRNGPARLDEITSQGIACVG
jgi:competence protein ComEC